MDRDDPRTLVGGEYLLRWFSERWHAQGLKKEVSFTKLHKINELMLCPKEEKKVFPKEVETWRVKP